MTAAQTVEMRTTGRRPSMVPDQVASSSCAWGPEDEEALPRISTRMHWATAWPEHPPLAASADFKGDQRGEETGRRST